MAERAPDEPPGERPEPPEIEPAPGGRFAAWTERGRRLRARADRARSSHASLEVGFSVFESDSSIGGGLLAGALAYRLFVLLLPVTLLLVSGVGLYADLADRSPRQVVEESGLHGLVASQVTATASGSNGWIVFLVMIPAALYALAKLYRAVAIVHALAWHQSARGIGYSAAGFATFGAVLVADLGATGVVGWIRRHNQYGGLAALGVYVVLVGGTWLLASRRLPHRDAGWLALVPGSLLVGVGLLFVNVFNVYVTTRLVENRANTYGVLGVATALLFSLVLVGRVVVVAAELNASLYDHRRGRDRNEAP